MGLRCRSCRQHAPFLAARPCVAAGSRVQRLPAPADGGGGGPRERRAGLSAFELAAAGQGDGPALVSAATDGGRGGGRRMCVCPYENELQ